MLAIMWRLDRIIIALDMQSPLTARIRHSVGTTCLRDSLVQIQVAEVDCPNYGRSTWTFFHVRESNDNDIFLTAPYSGTDLS